MFIRGMIGHIIQNDLQTACVRLLNDLIEILQGAKHRIDVFKIRDVIPKIRHRRRIDWGKPDCIDTKPLHIIQPREKARQITYAISVAVHETAWIYLVNNSALPPCWLHLFSFPIKKQAVLPFYRIILSLAVEQRSRYSGVVCLTNETHY